MPLRSEAFAEQPMTCAECIEHASDYIDGTLEPIEQECQSSHIAACAACARYHRVLERSLDLVRDVPSVAPSADFRVRLNRRLRLIDEQQLMQHQSVIAGASVTIAVAAVIAFLAWAPILQDSAAAPRAGEAMAVAAESSPANGDAQDDAEWRYPNGLSPYLRPSVSPPPSLMAAFPGPYSPLIIEPPAVGRSGSGRTVLATFYNVE